MARVRVERLPPERLSRIAVVGSVCCSSCCCCCCCLHALGGLVGAAMGSAWAVGPVASDGSGESARDGAALSVAVHWTVVVFLSITSFVIGSLVDVHDGIWIGLAAVVIGLPLFQLAAFVLGLVLAPIFPVPNKVASLKAVGKMALLSFVGSVIGAAFLIVVLIMVL